MISGELGSLRGLIPPSADNAMHAAFLALVLGQFAPKTDAPFLHAQEQIV